MANRIQHLRGSDTEHSTFTGEKGEISLVTDTSSNRIPTGELRIHDGSTAGGLPVKLGTSSKPLTDDIYLSSGTGINFSAYGSEDSNSATTVGNNLLDDYEEGTWNPGITGKTVTSSEGTYTKIGRQVLVRFELNSMNSSISNGSVNISNLPFTAVNLNVNGIAILGDISGVTFDSGYGDTYGRIYASTNYIIIMQKATNGSTHTGLLNLSSSFTIRGYALYTT